MTDWGAVVGGAAAIGAAALTVSATNWSTRNRLSAMREALEIRALLKGSQRDEWSAVVEKHLTAEIKRAAGPAPSTVGFLFFLASYAFLMVAIYARGAGEALRSLSWVLLVIGAVFFVIAVWILGTVGFVSLRQTMLPALASWGRSLVRILPWAKREEL